MVKVVCFFKRRESMSRTEFISYYENQHSKLAAKYLSDVGAQHYVRRYLEPFANWVTGNITDSGFDVVMEIWFKDQESFNAVYASPVDPAVVAEFIADEERLFDRSKMCFAVVDEHVSTLRSQ